MKIILATVCMLSVTFFIVGTSSATLIGATVHGQARNIFDPPSAFFIDEVAIVTDNPAAPEFTGSSDGFAANTFNYFIDIVADSIWVKIIPDTTDYAGPIIDLIFEFQAWPLGSEQKILSVNEVLADRVGVLGIASITSIVSDDGFTLWMPGIVVDSATGEAAYHLDITTEQTGNIVPEPTTMLLFGTGIGCLAAVGRRKRK